MMTQIAIDVGVGLVLIATALGLWRMFIGPSVVDRILAFDFVVVCSLALMVLLSIRWSTALYVELILIVAMLGFFGTVALMRYLDVVMPERGKDETSFPEDEP